MAGLRPYVVAAKQRLAQGQEALKERHRAGGRGVEICAAISDLRDEVILDVFEGALETLDPLLAAMLRRQVTLVPHGGYGRRDVAPFSDVDLMLLCTPDVVSRIGPLAERVLCDVFDVGLMLGHSVRTPADACKLAVQDAATCTSLVESRFLTGSVELYRRFLEKFRGRVRRRCGALLAAMDHERTEERLKFGETVYLLEPNVKRSRGALRDIQLVRWIGMIRYGTPEPDELHAQGHLSDQQHLAIREATEFLLWLRNEIHFHAGRAGDVLDRAEQIRISQRLGYEPTAGMLPVEQFMRDCFRHTEQVSHLASDFLAKARSARRSRILTAVFGHRLPGGYLAGPTQLAATRRTRSLLRGNLAEILNVFDLANLYDKDIATDLWEVLSREATALPRELGLPPGAVEHFLSLLSHPSRLGPSLRRLHELALLERFVPEFAHARGLLQFNQYHKYTVDEHSFRAVDEATRLATDSGPLGRVYRSLARKRILHLALLIHDLGKGFPGEHAEVGLRIAQATVARLGLEAEEAEAVKFLVHKHLLMNHLAFRRDTDDAQMVVRLAVEVGSPELLGMLYVMTAADLGAVGPDTWTSWKAEVVTDLYHRAMQHLAGESLGTSRDEYLASRRDAVLAALGQDGSGPWYADQVAGLPASYLVSVEPEQVVGDLRLLAGMAPGEVNAQGRYLPETQTVQFTVATNEAVTPGIFHKLTGALSSKGLEILSAQIDTLSQGVVLDRFSVYDPDFEGPPPPSRIEEVSRALVASLAPCCVTPSFRRLWSSTGLKKHVGVKATTNVRIDNNTSATRTIIDIFTLDHRGLLYAITRTLFELDYSVWRAKIGTFLDQVVDVFYVTDREGRKVENPARIQETRRRLLEVIEAVEHENKPT